MEQLNNNIYVIDVSDRRKLIKKGFKPYTYDLDENYDYSYCFSVYETQGVPIIYCKLNVDSEGYVNIFVHTERGEIYKPFYGTKYGNYDPIIEKINKKILAEFRKLGIEKKENSDEDERKKEKNMNPNEAIHVKYFADITPIRKHKNGDWIDLRAAENIEMKRHTYKLIPLGVAMKLPKGYEAHVVPRSSTFKNFGIIQTNHCGIIDESYQGNNDQWFFPAFAMRDTVIHKDDRICQFRIVKKQPEITFIPVTELSSPDRGGHGSTGIR